MDTRLAVRLVGGDFGTGRAAWIGAALVGPRHTLLRAIDLTAIEVNADMLQTDTVKGLISGVKGAGIGAAAGAVAGFLAVPFAGLAAPAAITGAALVGAAAYFHGRVTDRVLVRFVTRDGRAAIVIAHRDLPDIVRADMADIRIVAPVEIGAGVEAATPDRPSPNILDAVRAVADRLAGRRGRPDNT